MGGGFHRHCSGVDLQTGEREEVVATWIEERFAGSERPDLEVVELSEGEGGLCFPAAIQLPASHGRSGYLYDPVAISGAALKVD